MNVIIKFGNNIKEFENQDTIIIGGSVGCDFVVEDLGQDVLKMVFAPKYNNYVLMNVSQTREILCNNKVFSKILVTPQFTLSGSKFSMPVEIEVKAAVASSVVNDNQEMSMQNSNFKPNSQQANRAVTQATGSGDVESQRIAIIKEIGFKLLELKANIRSAGVTNFVLNVAMVILSVVSSFAITNFLLGLKIDNSSSVLNLTTNFGFLICVTTIVAAICLILKQGVYSLLDFNQNKRFGDSDIAQKSIIAISGIFLFVVYVMNLFYYNNY